MELIRKALALETTQSRTTLLAQAGWISLFAALTALGAQIEIPHHPVPFTLQTFFVLLSGAFLGARNGFIAQLLYLAVGAAGLPVFSGASFGVVRLFGITGGYLLSFPVTAALVGYLVSVRSGHLWTLFSMICGLLVVFTLGSLYLNFVSIHNLTQAFVSGFLIFSWWDILKLAAASAIYTEFSKRFQRLPE